MRPGDDGTYVYSGTTPDPDPLTVIEKAQAAVDGPRQKDYGHPIENHGCTGQMFDLWQDRFLDANDFHGNPKLEAAITTCAFNIIQKLSRLGQTPHHIDSLVDIVGYARNWEMCLDEGNPVDG